MFHNQLLHSWWCLVCILHKFSFVSYHLGPVFWPVFCCASVCVWAAAGRRVGRERPTVLLAPVMMHGPYKSLLNQWKDKKENSFLFIHFFPFLNHFFRFLVWHSSNCLCQPKKGQKNLCAGLDKEVKRLTTELEESVWVLK